MQELKKKSSQPDPESEKYEQRFFDFIEAAAHDLNSPLRKLSLLVELLMNKLNDVPKDELTEYTRRIESCIAAAGKAKSNSDARSSASASDRVASLGLMPRFNFK